jgi:hypothetical protein
MNNSQKLNIILENGAANKVADFIPRICIDSDLLIDIAENVHGISLYYKEVENMSIAHKDMFDKAIEFDYNSYIEYKDL